MFPSRSDIGDQSHLVITLTAATDSHQLHDPGVIAIRRDQQLCRQCLLIIVKPYLNKHLVFILCQAGQTCRTEQADI